MMERWYVDTMTETKSYETIAANVAAVREHMRQAALAAGRNPEDITLVAATKVQTSDTIRNAIRAGITICGENRVQELTAHLEDNAYEGARVHFIGHLQTNKVKFVVGKVDMIESIDSVRLMDAVEKQAAKVGVTQDKVAESFLRPLIAEGKTDEVAPKTARCLVIGDGKFRNKPGFVAHGLTLAGTDGTMVDRCTVRQRRDALRISQSAPAKSAMKSRAPIRIATMLMATCA